MSLFKTLFLALVLLVSAFAGTSPAQVKRKEEGRQRERREEKMRDLLEDYFYRSDHVDVPWEQGRDKIGKHSASKGIGEEDCKRMFDEHMAMLKEKMAKNAGRTGSRQDSRHGTGNRLSVRSKLPRFVTHG